MIEKPLPLSLSRRSSFTVDVDIFVESTVSLGGVDLWMGRPSIRWVRLASNGFRMNRLIDTTLTADRCNFSFFFS
jgi:hypothetical protein